MEDDELAHEQVEVVESGQANRPAGEDRPRRLQSLFGDVACRCREGTQQSRHGPIGEL